MSRAKSISRFGYPIFGIWSILFGLKILGVPVPDVILGPMIIVVGILIFINESIDGHIFP